MINRDQSSPCRVAFQAAVPSAPTPFVRASVRAPGLCALSVLLAMAPGQAHASTVPSAPVSPVATPGIAGASVSFTPSASDGGSPIIRYTVTSSPGGIAAIGGAPPIAVSGLTNGTSYTFTVTATNIHGPSAASAASNTVIPSAALAPWYNTLWTERKTIAVTGSAAAQTNYPVKLTLPYAAGMKADFSDLRFTDSSGTLLLSYWIETETANSTAVVWVKVPSVPIAPNTAAIYAYYGNPAAVSLSNGDTTFTFFDTFGGGGTPRDWNYTNNMIGEHAIIHNGKLYAPLYDSDRGANGGLVVLNPVTGSVIKHFTIPGYCTAAAPAFDKNGYLHIYDCGGFIAKLDENTGTVLRTLNIAGALDWEAVAYDPVNDVILIASKDDHSLSAVRASDYSLAWRNTDVNLTYGNSEIDPPLIVGAYVYWQDYAGVLFKISLSTGITAASTNATSAGLPASPYAFSSYSQIIYDSVNNRLYLTNSTGHTAFAVNPADLSVVWSRLVESAGWNFNRGGAWHNNVWYVTARETAYPYRSKVYALDTQNSGNILWTNTTAYDNGAEVSSVLADYNYVYAGTYDYSDQDYNKLLILNALDGSVAATIPLLNGVASSIPTFYGGKIIMGLWYDVSGQQVGGYQALQVRDGGGTADFYYKADLYQTGYVGAFASGPLTARTPCGYASLDPAKWIANGLSSITDCSAASTVNVSAWANYFKSNLTFSRANTAIRVRAKNSEPSGNSWDTWLGFTNSIGVCNPVCSGRNNGQMLFTYDQNGAPQTTFGPAYAFDQYNTSEVKMAYPSIQFDVDDSNIGGSTNWSTSYDQVPIQLGNFNGIATVDWVLVRNYVNPEPAPSIAAETSVTVPSAPLSPFATPGNGQASVSFTPPVSNGGSLITGYTVTSHPGNSHAGGSASPIIVPGLTNGIGYTFTVTASNATGDSSPSAASNSVTPGAAPDVTAQFSVTRSVVTLNRATGRYSQAVTITNNGAPLASAAYGADGLPAGVAMTSPDGFTSATVPNGSPYKELGTMGSGARLTIAIEFTRTGTQAFTYNARLLGPGPR
jgi:hypothetical protein